MIVKSILDTDLYKFTTSYAYMKLFPQARGTFEFFDRDLTEYPEDFVQKVYLELSNLGMLRLTNSELDYMTSNCRFVPQVYWEWLYSFRFNSGKVQVWLDDKKHLHITVTDYLYKVTLYEVPICWSQLCARHGEDVVNKVWSRHLASEFKRKKAPIYISRELYE